MNWARTPAVVRAPATSANLGPGFDAFGLALGLHDQVEAGVTWRRVRVVRGPLGDYERWECEWGYAMSELYGETHRALQDEHQTVANAHTATVMDGDPAGTAGGIEQRVQQRPVGNGVTPILHAFGLAEW